MSRAWLSPTVLVQQAMTDTAGTGVERHQAFMAQTREYVAALRDFFEPRALRADTRFSEFDAWPRCHWKEPGAAATRRSALSAAAALALASVLVGALASRALGRVSAQSEERARVSGVA